jgi:hypothetical protein
VAGGEPVVEPVFIGDSNLRFAAPYILRHEPRALFCAHDDAGIRTIDWPETDGGPIIVTLATTDARSTG